MPHVVRIKSGRESETGEKEGGRERVGKTGGRL